MQSALAPAGVTRHGGRAADRWAQADVYATLPALEPLHARLRIEEARLIARPAALSRSADASSMRRGKAPSFFHAYGSTGARIDNIEFLPHWLKARQLRFRQWPSRISA